MVCSNCKDELRIGTEQVGVATDGLPIFHRFGYCDKCMLKHDIDVMLQVQVQNAQYNLAQKETIKKEESGLGIMSLILSFWGIVTINEFAGFVFGIIAAIFGLFSICQNKKNKLCGSIGFVISIIIILVWYTKVTGKLPI